MRTRRRLPSLALLAATIASSVALPIASSVALPIASSIALPIATQAASSASTSIAMPISCSLATPIALAGPRALARAPDASDAAAVEAYRRGDLETARTLWSARLSERDLDPAERGRILYDVGNVAFREGKVLEAVGWYTASLRVRPRDGDAWANLEHARAEARLEPADRGDLTATVQRVLSSLTLAESEAIVAAAALVWLALAIGEALRGGVVWRRLLFAGALVVLATLPPWIYQRLRARADPVLVVASEDLDVRSEPRAAATAIASASPGAELERVDELAGWTKVRTSGGVEGWVESPSVFALVR